MDTDLKSSGSGGPEKSRARASYLANSSENSISPELISLVKRTALHLKGRLPSNIELDDLTQAGLEGLIQAMEAFDPSRNITLEQFAKTRIRGAMLDDVRRMSQTTRTTLAFKKEHTSALEKLTVRFGREPTGKEVASYLGKDLETYQKERLIIAGVEHVTSEETQVSDLEEQQIETSPEEGLQKDEMVSLLKSSISDLPERSQLVLSLYYQDELNLKEIAAVIDVSESRVSQILSETASKLRKKIDSYK